MQGARRTCLGLHLDDVGDLAPQVGPFRSRPVVAVLGHRRSRCDRVNRNHFVGFVSDVGGGFVAVDGDHAVGHD